ncbi:MAG: hypothetical protein WCI51_09460 [Lentisphaerota bacterium]
MALYVHRQQSDQKSVMLRSGKTISASNEKVYYVGSMNACTASATELLQLPRGH